MQKTLIGTAIGALALGGILVATTHGSSSASGSQASSLLAPGQASADSAQQPVVVNCGEGRQPVVHTTTVNGRAVSQVECGPATRFDPFETAAGTLPQPLTLQNPTAAPVLAPPAAVVTQPRTRVVYRDRPVYRDRTPAPASTTTTTTSSQPVYRSTAGAGTVADNGSYGGSRGQARTERQPRTWKKSAVIIGGSAAGGAAVGAVLGGGGGAKKGAVLGGVAGTIYDIATRNRR